MYTGKQKIEVYSLFVLILLLVELLLFFSFQERFYLTYDTALIPWTLSLRMIFPLTTLTVILCAISGALLWMKERSELRTITLFLGATLVLLSPLWVIALFFSSYPILAPVLFTLQWIMGSSFLTCDYMISKLSAVYFLPYWLFLTYKLLLQWAGYILYAP